MISEFRQIAYDALAGAGLPAPVFRFFNDDVNSLPTVQVGRPSLNPSDQLNGAWQIDLNVYVLGDRASNESGQERLDNLTWLAVEALEEAKAVGLLAAVTVASVEPGVTPVAGQDYPSYTIRFVGTSHICR